MKVIQIPALQDNYQYLLVCEKTNQAAIVDPADAPSVMKVVKTEGIDLVAIFNTHHHYDHVGGNEELYSRLKLPVYCSAHDMERIPHASHALKDNDEIEIGEMKFRVLEIPGHTHGQIAYYGQGAVFCGDTMFVAGCGRLFEGSPQQMMESLDKICELPDDTKLYCGHEYTVKNLQFALTLEPGNSYIQEALQKAKAKRNEGLSTVPSLLEDEKFYNPFLRTDSEEIIENLKQEGFDNLKTPVAVFAALRECKDRF